MKKQVVDVDVVGLEEEDAKLKYSCKSHQRVASWAPGNSVLKAPIEKWIQNNLISPELLSIKSCLRFFSM